MPTADADMIEVGTPSRVARSTARHYAADFRRFASWSARRGSVSLPASLESVVAFVEDELRDGFASSTVARRLAAIAAMHAKAGLPVVTRDPRVRGLLHTGKNLVRGCTHGAHASH